MIIVLNQVLNTLSPHKILTIYFNGNTKVFKGSKIKLQFTDFNLESQLLNISFTENHIIYKFEDNLNLSVPLDND